MKFQKVIWWVGLVILFGGCVHDPVINPEYPPENPELGCTASNEVCFESSILPIFISSCGKEGCHDAQSHKEGYIFDSYTTIVRKGIVPGNANESKVYEVLFGGEDSMPPYPNAPLTQAQKDSIKLWINQGAKNTANCNCYCDDTQFTYAAIIKPMVQDKCVGCHKPGTLSGDIDLSTYAAIKVQVDNGKFLGSITQASGFQPMPKGSKLSDCEITQVINWVNAGAPNN